MPSIHYKKCSKNGLYKMLEHVTSQSVYLESDVGILMHPKDLWFVAEWQALDIVSEFLNSVSLRCIVYTYHHVDIQDSVVSVI